ncbi:carbohydrate kinase [Georgenia sp. H159]|uniref:carbohydrate kinase family protein n=1 Tax=Georgenia sp. H159 TaxID=3076115 RepID=UPI002D78A86C|nr:carbohydrate kinase [Georgenia sp. H159]
MSEPQTRAGQPSDAPRTRRTVRGHETEPAVLVVGESLIDIVARDGDEPAEHVGGSPANVAVGLARLGNPVELVTWFGPDARGERIRSWLEADGVAVSAGSAGAERTSTARARIDASGAAEYDFDLLYDVPAVTPLREPALVHVGSISAIHGDAAAKVRTLVEELTPVATVSYDPNVRPAVMVDPVATRREVEALVARADVVKVSDEDVAWLAPGEDLTEVLTAWVALGPALVVVTRGAEGALALTAGGAEVTVPAPRVTVADTVGAGDSFMSGIIDGLARDGLLGAGRRELLRALDATTVRAILERAATIAAVTVSRPGANPPTVAELEAFTTP